MTVYTVSQPKREKYCTVRFLQFASIYVPVQRLNYVFLIQVWVFPKLPVVWQHGCLTSNTYSVAYDIDCYWCDPRLILLTKTPYAQQPSFRVPKDCRWPFFGVQSKKALNTVEVICKSVCPTYGIFVLRSTGAKFGFVHGSWVTVGLGNPFHRTFYAVFISQIINGHDPKMLDNLSSRTLRTRR